MSPVINSLTSKFVVASSVVRCTFSVMSIIIVVVIMSSANDARIREG